AQSPKLAGKPWINFGPIRGPETYESSKTRWHGRLRRRTRRCCFQQTCLLSHPIRCKGLIGTGPPWPSSSGDTSIACSNAPAETSRRQRLSWAGPGERFNGRKENRTRRLTAAFPFSQSESLV